MARLGGRAERLPLVGFLNSASPEVFAPYVASFLQGMKDGELSRVRG